MNHFLSLNKSIPSGAGQNIFSEMKYVTSSKPKCCINISVLTNISWESFCLGFPCHLQPEEKELEPKRSGFISRNRHFITISICKNVWGGYFHSSEQWKQILKPWNLEQNGIHVLRTALITSEHTKCWFSSSYLEHLGIPEGRKSGNQETWPYIDSWLLFPWNSIYLPGSM